MLALHSAAVPGYDMIDSRAIGMGRTANMDEPSPTSLLRAPSDALLPGGWMIETGYHRRFELADLDDLFLVGAWRHKSFTLAFGASQFGKTHLYAEQLLKGSVLYHWREFTFAGTISAMQVQIGNGYGGLRAATFGLGLGYRRGIVLASFMADDLTRPALTENSPEKSRHYRFNTQILSNQSYSFTGMIDWESGAGAQLGLGQIIHLNKTASVFWGIASEPLEYGGGLEFEVPYGAISYATSVHPTLGFSHTITLCFRPPFVSGTKGDDFD
jgi:hypothetical protein